MALRLLYYWQYASINTVRHKMPNNKTKKENFPTRRFFYPSFLTKKMYIVKLNKQKGGETVSLLEAIGLAIGVNVIFGGLLALLAHGHYSYSYEH